MMALGLTDSTDAQQPVIKGGQELALREPLCLVATM